MGPSIQKTPTEPRALHADDAVKAIINDRGRQYVVESDDELVIDHLPDVAEGDEVVFDQVLALGDTIGTPHVAGATVKATVKAHEKGQKLHVYKFKRRKDYRRKMGQRQTHTRVTIGSIDG